MQNAWPLRLLTEGTPDMVKIRSLMTRQPSDAVDSTASVAEREQEFLESTSPDAQSVVSHWFDAQSEAPASSGASQVDPTEEGLQPSQQGSATPPRRPSGLWNDWQARHSTEGEQQAAAADEVLKNLRHQHEQMAAQIFGLTGEVTELKEAVTSLKEDKRVLEQRLQQQEADKATEVFVARLTSRLIERIIAEQRVAAEHHERIRELQQRHSNLHGVMNSMQEQQRHEEQEERERKSTWAYHLRQSSMAAGCVALGACGVLVLIHVFEGKEGFRQFTRKT